MVRAVLGWGILSFAVLQIYEPVMHGLHLPEWTLTMVVVVLGVGFPATFVLAWIFDMGPGGVQRTPAAATTPVTPARRIRTALLLIGLGALFSIPGWVWYARQDRARPAATSSASGPPTAPVSPGTPPGPSIAVLPFADMSEKHDQEYFVDGVAEEILNALAHLDGLKVVGRTSSFSFKGKGDDLRAIGQKLDVANILEGSLRKDGDRLRVHAQLVRVSDGIQLWSETYERRLAGIFQVQDEIAQAVVLALKVKLLSGEAARPPPMRNTSPEAYRLYLLGREQGSRDTVAGADEAIRALTKATTLDPQYGPALAWLAFNIYTRAQFEVTGGKGADATALATADRAVAVAPDLAEAYMVRGHLKMFINGDWPGAQADIEHAIRLSPGDVTAQTYRARLLATMGGVREALRIARRALEIDPLSVATIRAVGDFQAATGDLSGAEKTFRRGLELEPTHARLLRGLGFTLIQSGRNREALELFERHPIGWIRHLGLALAHHGLGDEAVSRREVDALEAEASGGAAYQVAEAYAWRGERDKAFEWLARAVVLRDSGLAYVKFDPLLVGLHADPRWRPFLETMKLPVD